MLDYGVDSSGGKAQSFTTAHAAGAVVIGAILFLMLLRHGLRGLL